MLSNIQLDVQHAKLLQLDTHHPLSDDRPALMISSTNSRLLAMTVLKTKQHQDQWQLIMVTQSMHQNWAATTVFKILI